MDERVIDDSSPNDQISPPNHLLPVSAAIGVTRRGLNWRLFAILGSLVLFSMLGFSRSQLISLQAQSTVPVLPPPTSQGISPAPTLTPTPYSGFGAGEHFTLMTTTVPSQVNSYLCGQLVKTNGGLTQWFLPCSGNPQLLVLNYSQPTTPPGLVDGAYYRVSDPQFIQVSQQCHPTFGCTTTAILISVDSAPYDNWAQINSCDVSCSGGNTQPDLVPYQGDGWEFPVVPSSVTGTSASNTLYANQPTYFDWGVYNQGNAAPGALYYVDLFIDATRFIHYPFDYAPDPGGYFWFLDWNHMIDTPGWHTLKIVVDSENAINESDETNNVWERQFYWQPLTPTNQAPTVNAGIDQTITLPGSATLDSTVSDDGLPNPPGAVTTSWSKVSGSGTVTFGNAAAVDTTASFSAAGVYVLRLTANDSALNAFDEVTITANQQASCYTLTMSVNPSGGGQVTLAPAPNCQGSKYTQGTVVSLSATANTGYGFSHWSGAAGGNANPLSVTMDGNKSITANFTALSFSCNNVTEIPKTECEALVALYNSTNGASWTNKSGWLATNTPCSWYGVMCSNNHVTELSLGSDGLSGNIPPQLGNLTNLIVLNLYINQLRGSIPPELGNLTRLQRLSLSNNQLAGPIPANLGNLVNLQIFHAHGSQLTGSLPPELGNLANLQQLDLEANQLSGTIPPQMGNLTKLEGLGLTSNQLSGSLPPELGNLISLTGLSINNNQFSGALPTSLMNLHLNAFWFHNTSLCEPPDAAFQSWLASIPDLQRTNVKCASASSISGRVTDANLAQNQVAVDAHTEWQYTDIAVQTGDQVQVTYLSGTWTFFKGVQPYTDANGEAGRTDSCTFLPSANTGGLIGRIGTGVAQFLGNMGSFSAQNGGTLWLSMNDCTGQFHDNDGSLTVQVTITPASNHPIVGVTISDNAGHTATTDTSGNYTFSNLAAGTYTLTPSKSGYTFSPASRSVTVPPDASNVNFTGTQQQPTCYTLTTSVNPSGGGQITRSLQPNCQGTKYIAGTAVLLSATSNQGYTFSQWGGSASGNTNPLPITMDGDKNIIANFNLISTLPGVKITNFTLTDGALPQSGYPPVTQPETSYALKQNNLWFEITNGQTLFNPPSSGGHYILLIKLKRSDGTVVKEYEFSTRSQRLKLEELTTFAPNEKKSVQIPNLFFFDKVQDGKLEVIFTPDSTLNLNVSNIEKTITVGNHPDSVCSCLAEIARSVIKVLAAIPGVNTKALLLADLAAGLIKGGCKNVSGAIKELAKWTMEVLLELGLKESGKVFSIGIDIASEIGNQDIACLKLKDWLIAWAYEMMRRGFLANLVMTESPVYPLVINASGQRTGFLENGQIIEEIPESRAVVIGEKRIIMYPGQDIVNTQVVGYASGTMNLHAVVYQPDASGITLSYENVQVTQGMKATLTSTDEEHLLKIDANGDGIVDQSRAPDTIEHVFPGDRLYLPLVAK